MSTKSLHDAQDSLADYAAAHPEIRRFNTYMPKGCDQRGRLIDGQWVYPAEVCTGWGCDEDQSNSADGDALWRIFKLCFGVSVASAGVLAVWHFGPSFALWLRGLIA